MNHDQHWIPRLLAAALAGLVSTQPAAAKVRVVTTTTTLADIARQVGGEFVEVESVMRGPENVHNVAAKPTHMMKLRKADLFVHGGLDAEGWAPLLVEGARQSRLFYGEPGNVDASRGIALKEVPRQGELSRALGDLHLFGNTHYALDPLNGIIIASTIAAALSQADPAHREVFERNAESFASSVRELTDRLVKAMEPYRGTPVATYHRMWPYFLDRFGLVRVAEVEPKPGITPGPQHLSACVEAMRAAGAKVVIVETFNSRDDAETVARRVGGKAVVLAQEVNALSGVDSYQKMFEHDVNALLSAFKDLGVAAQQQPDTAQPGGTTAGGKE